MSESEEAPASERRVQKSLGLVPVTTGNSIDLNLAKYKAKILEATKQKPNGGQYLANILDVWLPTMNSMIENWVNSELSLRESWKAAKDQQHDEQHAREKQIEENVDQVIREALIEMHELFGPLLQKAVMKRLEERFG